MITEILLRLPLKFLIQLKCVCKPWNSLISDRKFARKHFRMSTMNPNLIFKSKNYSPEFSHKVYPLRSIFTNCTTTDGTHIKSPLHSENNRDDGIHIDASCDGILCLTQGQDIAVLWNPSIRKYKILPPLENQCARRDGDGKTIYGFGYDQISDNYKVVSVFMYKCYSSNDSITTYKTQVKVHTLGTNSWRLIDGFPYGGSCNFYYGPGKSVSGTINWLVSIIGSKNLPHILSLDLGTESYQEILQPDYGDEGVKKVNFLAFEILRDCLCFLRGHDYEQDIWLMKEYGNRESWTKLASVPYLSPYCNVPYISEDDQVLMEFTPTWYERELAVYDYKNGTLKSLDIKEIYHLMCPYIYVESLISPCS
jgi:F-box interacting protein